MKEEALGLRCEAAVISILSLGDGFVAHLKLLVFLIFCTFIIIWTRQVGEEER